MSKTQKITSARWALTVGLLLFSVQPAYPKKPKPQPQRATTTPLPSPADSSEFGGDDSEYDDSSARQVAKADTEYKQIDEQLAVTPPGPQRAALERKKQGLSDDVARTVEGCPNCPATLTAAAGMAMSEKNPEKAHGLVDRAVVAAERATTDPKQADKLANALTARGSFLEKAGEYERAHADAKYALKVKPGDKVALGLFYSTAGRAKGGAAPTALAPGQTTTPMFTPNPYNDPRYKELGQRLARVNALNGEAASKLRMGDGNEALRLALAAQTIEPTGKSFILEARAWMVLDKLADAIDRMGKAIDLLKKNASPEVLADAYGERARLQNMTGKKENAQGAISDANEALKLDAKNAPALRERGLAYETRGDLAAAEADLRRAAEFDPTMRSDVDDFYKRNAKGSSTPILIARPAENALHEAWTKLLGKAGGGLYLFVGSMGALLVLFAGWVFFFAKENSPMRSFFARSGGTPTATPPAREPAMPKSLDNGRYVIGQTLGEGGMGIVHEAEDTQLGRRVAVKSLRDCLRFSVGESLRFVGEAKAVAALQHPHIVQVFTIIEEQANTYIVYELIEGCTLHDVIRRAKEGLEPRVALEYLRQIASALDHAHANKVLHRDMKPSNVMVTQVNGKDWLKVMDFGIARQIDGSRVTMTGTIVGTPVYMAPEQEDGVVTKHSDQFSLGVAAYELLTLHLPFNGVAAHYDKRTGAFMRPSQARPGLPPEIDAVFEKVLHPNHEKRYARCAEFCQSLEAALNLRTTPK